MPRKSVTAAEAVALATLAYHAKIHLARQEITRGSYRVDLRVTGTVAGHAIDMVIAGEGTQSGPQTTAASEGPSKEELWAYGMQGRSAERREAIEEEAVALFAAEARLPNVQDDDVARAKMFLKACRASAPKTKAGAYTFAADPDPDTLESALQREAA